MKKLPLLFFIIIIISCFALGVFAQKSVFSDIEQYDRSETAKKANQKLGKNDISGALKILDKAIEMNEDLFEAYRTRSFIRSWYKNDIDGAISDLDKAIEIKPDDFDIYISRAFLIKRYKKDYKGALKDYETAQKKRPDSTLVHQLKAIVKVELADVDGAMAEIQAALKIQPEDIDLHIYQTNLLIRKNEPEQAIGGLQNFLKYYADKKNGKLPKIRGEKVKKKIPSEFNKPDDPINSVPVKRYSQMSFNADSPEDLRRQQAEVAEARSLSNAFLLLGKLLISKNMFDEAFKKLNTALEIDKNQEQAYALRGILYLSQNQAERAIDEFSDAIDIADDPSFYLNRGIAYLLIRNERKSRSDFDDFLKLYPGGQSILSQRIVEAKQKLRGNADQPK